MNGEQTARSPLRQFFVLSSSFFVATAAAYGAVVASAWWRYGHPAVAGDGSGDALLDDVMPVYDVVERHRIRVDAPANVTLAAARETDLFRSPLVRNLFRTRALVLRAEPGTATPSVGLFDYARSIGWGVLAESPGREIVMGAVTQPWKAEVTFHPLSADQFRGFAVPDYVKIAWTLRADPESDGASVFLTETRAVATDPAARRKFRRYWSFISPGVWLIRRLMLRPIKRAAESA
jgi:hypothetical protein